MAEITYKALLSDLKKGNISPVYLLHGDETFLLDKAEAAITTQTVDAATRDFNFTMLYGKDATINQVLENCYRYPVMSPKQVVVLREAQAFKEFPDLEKYMAKPVDTTVLVIVYKYKKVDGRTNLYKTFKEKGTVLTSLKLKDNEVVPWIKSYLKEESIEIAPDAAELIYASMGNDLSALMNSIDKLALNVADTGQVQMEDVHKYIGIHRSYNVFELNKAISLNDTVRIFEIVKYFEANPKANPIQMIVGTLNNHFGKLLIAAQNANKPKNDFAKAIGVSPYFSGEYITALKHFSPKKIERALNILKDTDLKSKGFQGARSDQSLKEMMVRIMS